MTSSTTLPAGTKRGRRTRAALKLAAVSASALLATVLTGGSASAETTSSLVLPVTPGHLTLMCLHVKGGLPANLTPVQVHNCDGSAAQEWTQRSDYTLRALGKCLDVEGGLSARGTLIDLYQCNGTGAQVWLPWSQGNFINPQSGKCLDDPDFSQETVQVEIWDCNGGASQNWSPRVFPSLG